MCDNIAMYLSRILGAEENFAREEEGTLAQQCDRHVTAGFSAKTLEEGLQHGRIFVKKTHLSRVVSDEESALTK